MLPELENSVDQKLPDVSERGKKKAKVPLVETQVRRSPRIKENNKGFKADICSSKKCLACNPNPPDLTPDMINKLGTSLCQIDENIMSEKVLNLKKKETSKTITKKPRNLKKIKVSQPSKKKMVPTPPLQGVLHQRRSHLPLCNYE
jgi:hypothetical protein